MLMLRDKENQLEKRLQQIDRSEKKTHWKKFDAQMISFPTLSQYDVENICFGNYRLNFYRNIRCHISI